MKNATVIWYIIVYFYFSCIFIVYPNRFLLKANCRDKKQQSNFYLFHLHNLNHFHYFHRYSNVHKWDEYTFRFICAMSMKYFWNALPSPWYYCGNKINFFLSFYWQAFKSVIVMINEFNNYSLDRTICNALVGIEKTRQQYM